MLRQENRLKKDRDFRKIFTLARPISSGRLSLRFFKKKSSCIRFGFVISNKIDKRSTHRNALKRRLRAIAREMISKIQPGYDIVVIVKENYSYPYQMEKISWDFQEGLKKAKILK